MELPEKIKQKEKLLHGFMLVLLFAFMWLTYPDTVPDGGALLYWIILYDFIVFVSCAYFISYFLLPRYFIKQKYLQFITLAFLVSLAGTTLILLNDLLMVHFFPEPEDEDKALRFLLFYGSTFGMTCMISSVGVSIRALIYWIKTQHHLNLVQQEHLKTELTFLRSQINPHFLFNAMNLIYGHIDKTNIAAREITLQFSDLLRYQLYECEAPAIRIEKEIDYLKQYVSLQKLRKNESFSCKIKLTGQLQDFEIPPLLMMPLVENAFKYASFGEAQSNFLDIELYGNEDQFSFSCINSKCKADGEELVTTKGLGLQNLRRRLELLYPGRHELHIEDLENTFKVLLSIKK